jgi:hypothetical protein
VNVRIDEGSMKLWEAQLMADARKWVLKRAVFLIQQRATEVLYRPGGKGYQKSKASFEKTINVAFK